MLCRLSRSRSQRIAVYRICAVEFLKRLISEKYRVDSEKKRREEAINEHIDSDSIQRGWIENDAWRSETRARPDYLFGSRDFSILDKSCSKRKERGERGGSDISRASVPLLANRKPRRRKKRHQSESREGKREVADWNHRSSSCKYCILKINSISVKTNFADDY